MLVLNDGASSVRPRRLAAVLVLAVLALLFTACDEDDGTPEDDGPIAFGPSGAITLPELESEELPPAAEYVHEHEGLGWESRAAADLGERDLLFLLYSVGLGSEVLAIDRDTGERVAEVSAGMRREVGPDGEITRAIMAGTGPLIAYAQGSGRLFYSDRVNAVTPPPTETSESWFRILVFSIADGLALESEIELPAHRAGGHGGVFSMNELGQLTISADERYLYFLGGDEDAEAGVIDLDGFHLLPIELPERCSRVGPASLFPMGDSSVIATCPGTGAIRVLTPSGVQGADIEAGRLAGEYDPALEFDLPVLVPIGAETPDGIGVIYHHGAYAVAGPAGITLRGRVLPPERGYVQYTWRSGVLAIDDRHLAIPYHDEWPFRPPEGFPPPGPDGFVIFNTETATVERDIEVPHRGAYPLNAREIALVNDGRIDILDLTTMTIVRSFGARHPDRPEVLPALR